VFPPFYIVGFSWIEAYRYLLSEFEKYTRNDLDVNDKALLNMLG
jgi:hypothetical protein